MNRIIALAALLSPAVAHAEPRVMIDSSVFVERKADIVRQLKPAERLASGDRIVKVLRWKAPANGEYTATTTPVPKGVSLRGASREGMEFSTDGGRSWQRLADGRFLPQGITHLRWPLGKGPGSLTYRAIVL
ncbi:hypothetical protein FHS61_001901 [Altererythrobacter atlanticus]|uniref:Uncharacterized protein n=1 Tax=Croceibacterium atlanticum TaxID=1267766 RepID=A0A0F7KLJ5_9SPHN|nr:hypothetical protein [Croceibacterium atlanticum]AKH41413.1 hypothetical protein WYH_00350 [Croceibacterium atlanticum]MBB5732875.1 hypothetical protein [Croceibacterium atlanticum]